MNRNSSPLTISSENSKLKTQNSKLPSPSENSKLKTLNSKFLVELGLEELPAADLTSALDQLRAKAPALLNDLRLTHGDVRILGTPRRLVLSVEDLAPRQPDRTSEVKGPPASRAFDALGQPTRAAEGFARSRGVEPSALQVREIDGGSYVVAIVDEPGRPALDVLAEALPGLIASLRFDKTMRWNASGVAFSRPIRWLLALFGDQLVPFEYAGVRSAAFTRGLRFHDPEVIPVADPAAYFAALAAQGIVLDPQARMDLIRQQAGEIMVASGGDPQLDPALLDEVNNLVEAPTALRGAFDPHHLEILPPDVIISVMAKHQRYFPIRSAGNLLPYFITVRNGDTRFQDVVVDGNEQVIRARFADAAFFVNEDLEHPLIDYLPRLGTLTFQKKLGSMLDKSHRVRRLVEALLTQSGTPVTSRPSASPTTPRPSASSKEDGAPDGVGDRDTRPAFALSDEDAAAALRAAELCKADLVTHMVIEMTTLQGVMGRYYALHSGETPAVAQAIYEHYLPRFAGESAPTTLPGLLVGLADRLDTLAGLFAAGLAPTGTKDPFAQRRAALGLVLNLISWDLDFDLAAGLEEASHDLPVPATPESLAACLDFIAGRLRTALTSAPLPPPVAEGGRASGSGYTPKGGHASEGGRVPEGGYASEGERVPEAVPQAGVDQGIRYDVVDAVMAAQKRNPAGVGRAVRQLSAWVARPDWSLILPAYARCVRITRAPAGVTRAEAGVTRDPALSPYPVDLTLLTHPAEKALLSALETAEKTLFAYPDLAQKSRPVGAESPAAPLAAAASVDAFLTAFLPLIPPINAFFEAVMVMDEDPALRNTRLGLLQRISALAAPIADLSLLEGF